MTISVAVVFFLFVEEYNCVMSFLWKFPFPSLQIELCEHVNVKWSQCQPSLHLYEGWNLMISHAGLFGCHGNDLRPHSKLEEYIFVWTSPSLINWWQRELVHTECYWRGRTAHNIRSNIIDLHAEIMMYNRQRRIAAWSTAGVHTHTHDNGEASHKEYNCGTTHWDKSNAITWRMQKAKKNQDLKEKQMNSLWHIKGNNSHFSTKVFFLCLLESRRGSTLLHVFIGQSLRNCSNFYASK